MRLRRVGLVVEEGICDGDQSLRAGRQRGGQLTVGIIDIRPVDHHHQGRVRLEDVVRERDDHDDGCGWSVERQSRKLLDERG